MPEVVNLCCSSSGATSPRREELGTASSPAWVADGEGGGCGIPVSSEVATPATPTGVSALARAASLSLLPRSPLRSSPPVLDGK